MTEWLRDKGLLGAELFDARQALLKKWMFVKGDKPNSCYHYDMFLQDLERMPVEDFVKCIRGQPTELSCEWAIDLLWKVPTRFKSVMSFREMILQTYNAYPQTLQQVQKSPIILLDPIKPIYGHKFTYQLTELSKNPNRKQEYRKEVKKKNQITSSQGRPIFSAFEMYRHYMTTTHWMRAAQLPSVLAFFERALHSQTLIARIGQFIHPEFVLWATSASGVHATKRSYETLETYGDTILKLAATHLAYDSFESERHADEKKINDRKNAFVTNLYLFRIGHDLGLREFMRSKDSEPKQWSPPFTDKALIREDINCTGKNIADGVEALIGAFFLSNNLYKTLKWLSDIRLVPMEQAQLLQIYPDEDLTFQLSANLDAYQFSMEDSVKDIFVKYFSRHSVDAEPREPFVVEERERDRVFRDVLKLDCQPPLFAEALVTLQQTTNLKELDTSTLVARLKELVCAPVEKILNFQFANKNLLLEALTHRSFKETYCLTACYEKMEVLGDAILDYIANANLIKYTMFEKYNIEERLSQVYITQEDFKPFDAHQAKSLLTKNDFLAKLITLFGIHEFILYEKKKPFLDVIDAAISEGATATTAPDWQKKKQQQMMSKEYDLDRYIRYSFKKDFKMNNREIEIFEPCKIMGDVFEALIGAIFIDGGIKEVLRVFQHLLAPFLLHVAKYSKKLNKEPKEDF